MARPPSSPGSESSPALPVEHDVWHFSERLPERMGGPGFLRGRRVAAVDPQASQPRFILYGIAPEVLRGVAARPPPRRARRVSPAEAVSRYQRPVTCFHAKVAGVAYDNRQAAIAKLSALETLGLVPEPDNSHDPNAIKVCRRTGEQIGYLKRNRARQLVEKLQLGHRCFAFVKRVSGGETHYVSITVLVMSPRATDQEVLDWINRYDVLGGITLSLSPEGKLVASPAVDLVPDVTARSKERRGPGLTLRFEPPTARWRAGVMLRFQRDTEPGRPSFRGWPIVAALLVLVLVIVLALLRKT